MLQKGIWDNLIRIQILLFLTSHGWAQKKECIDPLRGQINSDQDHVGIPFASLQILEDRQVFFADSLGNFEICGLPKGQKTLIVRQLGYDSLILKVETGKRKWNIHLREKNQWIDAIDVKGKHRHFESAAVEAEALHREDLDQNRGTPLGQILRGIPGVSAVQTGPSLFKPMIQGLTGQRIAIVQSGVKLEGQQWGFDHAPETDAGLADEIVVVKGAQAVRFGADAIGGTILMEPGDFSPEGGFRGWTNSGFSSNNRGWIQGIGIENRYGSHHRISWRMVANGKKTGDARTPRYILGNTGQEEFSVQTLVRHEWGSRLKNEIVYSHYATRIGIFTGSHISSPEGIRQAFQRPDSSYRYRFSYQIKRPSQAIRHQIFKAKSTFIWNPRHSSELVFSYQRDNREEFDLLRSAASACATCPQLFFELDTRKLELIHTWKTEGKEVKSGLVGTYQSNIVEKRILVPNFRLSEGAGYVIGTWFSGPWGFEAGSRLEYRHQQIFRYVGDRFEDPVRLFWNSMVNLGVRYRISDHWHIKLNSQRSQRAPNVSELYSDGVHHGSAGFERGDAGLRSEQILNAISSLHHESRHWEVLLGLYQTWSPDLIYLSPVKDSIISTVRGPFPLFHYRQSEVSLRGLDFRISYRVPEIVQLELKGATLHSRNITDRQYLVWQPADWLEFQIRYSIFRNRNYLLEAQAGPRWVAKQCRFPEGIDFTDPPPGYVLWNGRLSLRKEQGRFRFHLSLEGQNLANQTYRDYMNRFRYYAWDVGRNFIIRLQIPFSI